MNEDEIKVLYLDDELSNVTGFKATFRREYYIVGVTTSEEAFEALAKENFHVIIADQRMPGITGVEFFASILNKYPDPIRILMTGYADSKDTIDAINKGQIFRYISKPWKEEEVVAAISNAYDIYHQRKELQRKNEELQKAYDELNRFVYSASHDMRAPLMSILGIIKVAKMEHQENVLMSYMEMIEKSVNQLNVFNTNLIDYYTNSKNEQVHEKIDFKTVFEDLIDTYKYYPNADKIVFKVNVQQTEEFYGDIFRLRVVLNNLISNAIKFHQEDRDQLFIELYVEANEKNALVKISDNGIGIDEEHLGRIFDMFFRATRKNSGSGIGLYIVKEALDKMNGTIDVQSRKDHGTTFSLIIPNQRRE